MVMGGVAELIKNPKLDRTQRLLQYWCDPVGRSVGRRHRPHRYRLAYNNNIIFDLISRPALPRCLAVFASCTAVRNARTPLSNNSTLPRTQTLVSYLHTYLYTRYVYVLALEWWGYRGRVPTVREYNMHNGIMRVVRVRDASPYIMGISMLARVLPPFWRGLRYSGVRDISVFMCPVGHGEKPSNGLRGTRARRRCTSVPLAHVARRMHRL